MSVCVWHYNTNSNFDLRRQLNAVLARRCKAQVRMYNLPNFMDTIKYVVRDNNLTQNQGIDIDTFKAYQCTRD